MASYLDGFAYEVGEITVDEEADTAVAKVSITIKSMADIMTNFQTAFTERLGSMDLASMTEAELYKEGGKILLEVTDAAEPKDSEIEMGYTKNEDGEWEVDDSAEAALMGAMMA